jgi:alpha 1,3-glucosidase
MPKDNVHFGGLTHGEVHNMYGFYHGIAGYNGHILRRNGEDRPFILTRSFFAGSQRYVAVWTGDNTAKFEHLKKAQPMLMQLGISGLTYVGGKKVNSILIY